jgi:fibronectin type 3 domain-containing protein
LNHSFFILSNLMFRRLAFLLIGLAILTLAAFRAGAAGASMPFTSVEAESGALGGGATITSLTPPTNSDSSPQLEASGHAYAQLSGTGQSLSLENNTGQNVTALNVRYSIPDALSGGGITATLDLYVNGSFRQAINLNSKQTWCYQSSGSQHGWSKNPSSGKPHIFWDETHFFISGSVVPPGGTITFQQDSGNTAPFYRIDVVDMENPPGPLSQPANSLSITSYGAEANNSGFDNTTAIHNCISAAQSQSKSVWIPQGTFYLSSSSASMGSPTGITISGAGPWYSAIYANPTLPASPINIVTPYSCVIENLAFDSDAIGGGSGQGNGGGPNVKGSNWIINNVWIQHLGAGVWADGVNGLVENTRVDCSWADGINVNNGNGASGNNTGNYLVVSNCFVRGTGDDGLALNSGNSLGCIQMTKTTCINCTSVAPWWANNLGIYGGVNILVSNNLCQDSCGAYGISIGVFDDSGLPLESGIVSSNTILRGGSYGWYNQDGVPAMNVGTTHSIDDILVQGNTINDAVFMAMGVELCDSNITIQNNTINSPTLDGIDVASDATGVAILYSNRVTELNSGRFAFADDSSAFVVANPIAAAAYGAMSGVVLELCGEGGQDVGGIHNGDWTAYNAVTLTGPNTFVARTASAGFGGNIEIHLASPTGTLVGVCPVGGTGGSQFYVNSYCPITGATGAHTVYLVYRGAAGTLFSLEYFAFFAAPPNPSYQLVVGDKYALKSLANGKYVTAPNGGANSLIASSMSVGTAEEFLVVDAGGGNIGFQAMVNSNIVTAENAGNSPLIANRASVGPWETFTELEAGGGNIAIRADVNDKYVTAPDGGANPLIAQSATVGAAESFGVEFVSGAPPAAPSGLTASSTGSQVTLTWAASLGATGYNVKRSSTNGGPYSVIATNLSATHFADSQVTLGATYYYVVSALNPAGESSNSSSVTGTPGALNRNGWIASASSTESGGLPANAIDGNLATRWSTGANQAVGMWFQVDMGATNTFYQIVLNVTNSPNDDPVGYRVNLSNDGTNWGSPVAAGSGTPYVTTISFPTNTARFIRVTLTANSGGGWWSIDEFNVLGANGTLPPAPAGLLATPGSNEVVLYWDPAALATSYNVKISDTNGGPYTLVAANVAGLSYTNVGLPDNATYYYVVSGVNAIGEGSNSAPASVALDRPLPLAIDAISGDGIQLAWTTNDNGGSFTIFSATNLASEMSWTLITNAPILSGPQWILALPISTNNQSFYRLKQ